MPGVKAQCGGRGRGEQGPSRGPARPGMRGGLRERAQGWRPGRPPGAAGDVGCQKPLRAGWASVRRRWGHGGTAATDGPGSPELAGAPLSCDLAATQLGTADRHGHRPRSLSSQAEGERVRGKWGDCASTQLTSDCGRRGSRTESAGRGVALEASSCVKPARLPAPSW